MAFIIKSLVVSGERQAFNEIPPRVENRLTDKGQVKWDLLKLTIQRMFKDDGNCRYHALQFSRAILTNFLFQLAVATIAFCFSWLVASSILNISRAILTNFLFQLAVATIALALPFLLFSLS
jgi:hypothetical protein